MLSLRESHSKKKIGYQLSQTKYYQELTQTLYNRIEISGIRMKEMNQTDRKSSENHQVTLHFTSLWLSETTDQQREVK